MLAVPVDHLFTMISSGMISLISCNALCEAVLSNAPLKKTKQYVDLPDGIAVRYQPQVGTTNGLNFDIFPTVVLADFDSLGDISFHQTVCQQVSPCWIE
jgi:hypothetical protein